MKYGYYLLSSAMLFAFALAIGAFFLVHEFENIESDSLLKYLVDKEIRNLPIINRSSDVTYQSYPVNGTSKGFDGVKLTIKDKADMYDELQRYFSKLGYSQIGKYEFMRNGDKITIEQYGNVLEVTKFTW